MKKILRKSLSQLRMLLLLAVMFVAGSSAWAETVTFVCDGNNPPSSVNNGVTLQTSLSHNRGMGYFTMNGSGTVTLSSSTKSITKVTFKNDTMFGSFPYSDGIFTTTDGTATFGSGSKYEFAFDSKNRVTINVSYGTRVISSIEVEVSAAAPAATPGDLTFTSANGNAGGKVVPVLAGDVLTFEGKVTYDNSKKIQFHNGDRSNSYHTPTINNNTLTFNFNSSYTLKADDYYLEIPAGAFTVGNVYNQNSIVIRYTVGEVGVDLNIVSANGGKEFITGKLTGDVLTFDDNVTIDATPGITLDGNAITPSVNGNTVSFTYSDLANGTHTLSIPAGVLHVGNAYNQSAVNFTYTVKEPTPAYFASWTCSEASALKYILLPYAGTVETLVSPINVMIGEEGSAQAYRATVEDMYNIYRERNIRITLDEAYEGVGNVRIAIPGDFLYTEGGHVYQPYASRFEMTGPETRYTIPASLFDAESNKYYTTYYDGAFTWHLPAGCQAYYVASVSAEGELELDEITNKNDWAYTAIAADQAILLVSDADMAGVEIKKSYLGGAGYSGYSAHYVNYLHGTADAQNGIGGDGAKYYVLSSKDGKAGFYWDPRTKDEGATLNNGAHKAYLKVPAAQASNISGFRFNFGDDDVTAIKVVETEKNDAIYNLQGQRVNATAAGIYVKNGRKFIVK